MPPCEIITADVLHDCDNVPVAGIEQKLILINYDDLLASGITFDVTTPSTLITDIALEAGKTGYLVENIKQIMNYTNSLEYTEDSENGIIHSINGIRFYDPSASGRDQLNKLIRGAKVYAVLETKWKGTDGESAFKFFGLNYGLELKELIDNSNENDGTVVISLGTPQGFKEPFLPHILLDTDYDTTKTAFDNKFAAA